jgi:hypothetical protein
MKEISHAGCWMYLLIASAPSMTGCLAMSSYQSARMTAPGPARPMLAVSTVGSADNFGPGGDASIWVIDARLRKGVIRDRADFGFNTSLLAARGGGLLSLGLEPRVSIVRNILAAGLPVSFYLGAPFPQSIQWAPGVVLTIPVSNRFELNAAVRMQGMSYADGSVPVYNFGVAFSDDLRESAIRPEIGIMQGHDDDEWIVQVGVGFEPRRSEVGD